MITTPKFLTERNIKQLISFCNCVLTNDEEKITIDAESLSFVDPLGLCLVSATCDSITNNGQQVEIINLSKDQTSYLTRMDLLNNENIICEVANHSRQDRRTSLVEIKKLTAVNQVDKCANDISNAIVGSIPDLDPNQAPDEMTGFTDIERLTDPISYILTELLQNALTHGRRNGFNDASVWVAAQYYSSNDTIQLSVIDNGAGYLSTLRDHPDLISADHLGAIRTALLPDTTCNINFDLNGFESVNQGIRLTVVHDLSLAANGKLTIASGDSILRSFRNNTPQLETDEWQGSLISIEMSRQTLKTLNIRDVINNYQLNTAPNLIEFED